MAGGEGGEGVLPIREAKLFTAAWERIAGALVLYIAAALPFAEEQLRCGAHTPVPARQIGPAASD